MATQIYNRPDPGTFGYSNFTGDGSTNSFAVSFAFPNKGKLAAGSSSPYLKAYINGNETAYTFTSTANDTVTFAAAPANTASVELVREAGIGTLEIYSNGSDLDADTLANDSNRQAWIMQDIWTRLKFLGASVGAISTNTGANEYNFTGNGSNVNFDCNPETATGDARVLVFVNGVRQPTSAYNVILNSGFTRVQFLAAPANATAISVVIWNSPIFSNTPDDASITTVKLADGSVTLAKLGMNASGTNNQALMKRAGAWTNSTILPSDVSGFDAQVQTSKLNQMAAPVAAVGMNGQLLSSLATGISGTDAVNLTQMNTAITAAITALGVGNFHCKGGSASVSSTSFGTVSVGFAWATLILRFDFNNGDVGVRATNTSDTGGSGLNGSVYNPAAVFMFRQADIASAQKLQIRQNPAGAFSTNDNEVEIQYVTNGFQIRRTGNLANTYSFKWFASTDF